MVQLAFGQLDLTNTRITKKRRLCEAAPQLKKGVRVTKLVESSDSTVKPQSSPRSKMGAAPVRLHSEAVKNQQWSPHFLQSEIGADQLRELEVAKLSS